MNAKKDKPLTLWDIFGSAQVQFKKNGIKDGLLRIETVGELIEGERSVRLTLCCRHNGEQREFKHTLPEHLWRLGLESAVKTLIQDFKNNQDA